MSRRASISVVAIVIVSASAFATGCRVARVRRGYAEIPAYPGSREGPARLRYWPHLISWDDRSSARVDRIFAVGAGTTLLEVARRSAAPLAARGWYLVAPDRLDFKMDPQVIVWQRDPDERLDLVMLWPVPGLSRTQRLYGGQFPEAFLDEPAVVGWTWSVGAPRSPRPSGARPR